MVQLSKQHTLSLDSEIVHLRWHLSLEFRPRNANRLLRRRCNDSYLSLCGIYFTQRTIELILGLTDDRQPVRLPAQHECSEPVLVLSFKFLNYPFLKQGFVRAVTLWERTLGDLSLTDRRPNLFVSRLKSHDYTL